MGDLQKLALVLVRVWGAVYLAVAIGWLLVALVATIATRLLIGPNFPIEGYLSPLFQYGILDLVAAGAILLAARKIARFASKE